MKRGAVAMSVGFALLVAGITGYVILRDSLKTPRKPARQATVATPLDPAEPVATKRPASLGARFTDDNDEPSGDYPAPVPRMSARDYGMTLQEFTRVRISGESLGSTKGDGLVDFRGFPYVAMATPKSDGLHSFGESVRLTLEEIGRQKVLVSSRPMLEIASEILRADTIHKLEDAKEGTFPQTLFPIAYEPTIQPPLELRSFPDRKVFVAKGFRLADNLPRDTVEKLVQKAATAGWKVTPPIYMRISDPDYLVRPALEAEFELILPVEPLTP
jgi:hypothetical protein